MLIIEVMKKLLVFFILALPALAISEINCLSLYKSNTHSDKANQSLTNESIKIFKNQLRELQSKSPLELPIPLLSLENIDNLESINTDGITSSFAAFRGQYQGRSVFIKVMANREVEKHLTPLSESQWLFVLNKLNIGVKLIAHLKFNNNMYIVTEFQKGFNSKRLYYNPIARTIITPKMIESIKKIGTTLELLEIIPIDLQFLINPESDSLILIDPEFFNLTELFSTEQVKEPISTEDMVSNLIKGFGY